MSKLQEVVLQMLLHPAPVLQMESFHFQVGGLRDTVQPYNPHENIGTGWTFDSLSGEAFREAIWNAIYTFR